MEGLVLYFFMWLQITELTLYGDCLKSVHSTMTQPMTVVEWNSAHDKCFFFERFGRETLNVIIKQEWE